MDFHQIGHHCHEQVLGTLLIYVLFMVEEFRKAPVENMDEVIYYVNGTYRLLEFVVSVTHTHCNALYHYET